MVLVVLEVEENSHEASPNKWCIMKIFSGFPCGAGEVVEVHVVLDVPNHGIDIGVHELELGNSEGVIQEVVHIVSSICVHVVVDVVHSVVDGVVFQLGVLFHVYPLEL